MKTFREFISESISDKGIFKAIFVIGLPGAGKSYTISKISGALSPRIVNTDRATEFLGKKQGVDINSQTWPELRDSTHRITKTSLSHYIDGMLPLFVDGTSNDVSNILHRIGILESLGYDIGVAFVKTDVDIAIKRANERAKKIGRFVDEEFIRHVYEQNEDNANYLKSKVDFFVTVENNSEEFTDKEMLQTFKKVQSFFEAPIENPIGKRYIETLKHEKHKYLTPHLLNKEVLDKKIAGWYKI